MPTTTTTTPTLLIPTALRGFTEDQAQVAATGKTVGELLTSLTKDFPDISQHLFDDDNQIRSYINIFVGDDNIKDLQGLDTPVGENAEVSIVPAIAGGSGFGTPVAFGEQKTSDAADFPAQSIMNDSGFQVPIAENSGIPARTNVRNANFAAQKIVANTDFRGQKI